MTDKRQKTNWNQFKLSDEQCKLIYDNIKMYNKDYALIFKMYYMQNKSQVYIGKKMGFSKARAWQIVHILKNIIIPKILKKK